MLSDRGQRETARKLVTVGAVALLVAIAPVVATVGASTVGASSTHKTHDSTDVEATQAGATQAGATQAGATQAGATPGNDASRSLSSTTVAPGGSVTVTVTADPASSNVTINESFSPAFDSAQVTSVTVDGQPIDPVLGVATSNGVVVTATGVGGDSTITVTYTVSVASDASEGDTYTIDGQVSSGDSTSDLGTAQVTVEDNSPPTADAGDDRTVPKGTSVTLDGSGSSDPDGDSLSYQWTQTSGPSVSLSGASSATPSFTAPDVGQNTTLTFELNVSDGTASDTDTVSVTVVNRPPTADAGDDRTVDEGATVTLDASGSSDPDGDSLSFQWTQTRGPSVSLSDAATATPTFTAPDRDSTTTYTFEVTVSDGTHQQTDTVSVTVEHQNEAPSAALSASDGTVDLGDRVSLDAAGSSDPDGSIVEYRWAFGDGATATGERVSHSYDDPGTYTIELTVEGSGGATDTATTTVTVEQPTLRIDSISGGLRGTPLEDVSLTETYTAKITSGAALEKVTFEVDDQSYSDTDGSDGWSADVKIGQLERDSILTVTAQTVNGQTTSETTTVPVQSIPGWLSTVVSVGDASVDRSTGEISVTKQIPDPPIDASIQVPGSIPLIGGPQSFKASSSFGVTYDMTSQTATISGSGSLEATILQRTASGTIGVEGTVGTNNWDVRSGHAWVGVSIEAFSKTYDAEVAGYGVEFDVSITPSARLDVYFDDTPSGFEATRGSVTPGISASALLQTSVAGASIEGELTGSLSGTVSVPKPYNPGGTASLTGTVTVSALGLSSSYTVLDVSKSFGSEATGTVTTESVEVVEKTGWHTADKFGAMPGATVTGVQTATGNGTSDEALSVASVTAASSDRVTGNRLADRSPSVAFDGSADQSVVVWSRQRKTDTVEEGREIFVATGTDTGWTTPAAVTDNRKFDTDPAIAVDDDTGRAVAVWVQVDAVLPKRNLSTPSARNNRTEVVYAVRSPDGTWSAPTTLTNNSVPDSRPAIAYDEDAGVWQLAWQQSPDGARQVTDATTVQTARATDGELGTDAAFDTPVGRSGAEPTVASRAGDGVFSLGYFEPGASAANGSVVLARVGASGSVSKQRSLSTTAYKDLSVANGSLVWVDGPASDTTIHSLPRPGATPSTVGVTNVSDVRDLTLIERSGTTVLTYRGQPTGSSRKAVFYRVRRGGTWLNDHRLTDSTAANLSYWQVTTALADDGTRFRSVFMGQQVSAGQKNDLFSVRHELRPDLAVSTNVTDAGIGDQTTLTYTITNVGDTDVQTNTTVVIKAGPSILKTIPVPKLAAGESISRTTRPIVPTSGRIGVEVDPGDVVTELDENNTVTRTLVERDLAVADVTATRNGSQVRLNATIATLGAAVDRPITYEIRAGATTIKAQLDRLAANSSTTVTHTLDLSAIRNRTVAVEVDPNDRIGDVNPDNDVWTGRPLVPDLFVWNGSVSYGNGTGGVNVTVAVGNRGTGVATANVTLYSESGSPVSKIVTINGSEAPNATVFRSVTIPGVNIEANESVEVFVTSPAETDTGDNAVRSTVPDSVDTGPFDGIIATYNRDGDSQISIRELGTAAADYASGQITIRQLGQIAAAYASS